MIDTSRCQAYFDEVVGFAVRVGRYDAGEHSLKKALDYLGSYADHENKGLTRCILLKDFAPYSFEFVMHRRVTDVEAQRKIAARGVKPENGVYWQYWFSGGVIFHGAHDGGGDGSAPTFAVSLTPTDGWSVHT